MALMENQEVTSSESDLDLAEKDPTYTRRQFLKWGIYGVAGAVTIAIGVPTVLYFINPAFKASDSSKVLAPLGAPADFANQTAFKEVQTDYKYIDTFKEVDGTKKVFIRALKPNAANPEDFLVLDSTCTHLGCSIFYNPPAAPPAAKDKFYCFCHGSIFDQNGKNLAVAPKPLPSYKVELKDGKLAINVFGATAS